ADGRARAREDAGDERAVALVSGAAVGADHRTVLPRRPAPVRPLYAARDGQAARDDGAWNARRQAVVGPDAAGHARPVVPQPHPALSDRRDDPAQDRRLP